MGQRHKSEDWDGEGCIRTVEKDTGKSVYKQRDEDKSTKILRVIGVAIWTRGLDN